MRLRVGVFGGWVVAMVNVQEEWAELWRRLHESDYLVWFLLPMVVWGLFVGLWVVGLSVVAKSVFFRRVGLVMVFVFGGMMYPYVKHRERASGVLVSQLSEGSQGRFAAQTRWLGDGAWMFYGLAGLGFLGLFVRKGWGVVVLVVLVAGGVVVLHGGWLLLKEGEVYRGVLSM